MYVSPLFSHNCDTTPTTSSHLLALYTADHSETSLSIHHGVPGPPLNAYISCLIVFATRGRHSSTGDQVWADRESSH
jgi:hypothetical protein